MTLAELSQQVQLAHSRIESHILKTPLIHSHALSKRSGAEVYLKLESEQYTGSFKARGSLNKLLKVKERGSDNRLITASTGNHGLGFARGIGLTGLKGTVYLPHSASKAKVKKLGYYPVDLEFYGEDSLSTELHAREMASSTGSIWVSPYNDYDIISGQGTIAMEMLSQAEDIDDVFITVGGGGLISGIGTYLKVNAPDTRVVSCQPFNSREMTLSLTAGKIVDDPDAQPTLSDGSAGGIEPGAITFNICQQVIDETITVTEEEIISALQLMIHEHGKIIEGSAAVTIASLLKEKEKFKGRRVVLVICGGNIDIEKLKSIL